MAKIGVVFSNLGTPKSTNPKDIGRYLDEFLMDRHVIQAPWWFRALLVKGVIVPIRSKKTAAKYEMVWTDQGSPLLVETEKAASALQEKLGNEYQVEVGMRYGEPSFKTCAEKLKGCDQIIYFPQYPQYAASTVQTGIEHFFKYFDKNKVKVIEPYYDDPDFLEAYGKFLKKKLSGLKYDKILMSFHGLPESHVEKKDSSGSHCLKIENCCEKASGDILKYCYRAQCLHSARGIAKAAGLESKDYTFSFQSRVGVKKWIQPYTEDMYETLVSEGVKDLVVICPGFPVDGLETLEEIAMEGKESFLEKGGQNFTFLPCLNDDPDWIEACVKMVRNG